MPTPCPGFYAVFLAFVLFFSFLVNPVFATHQCGNGTCSHGETTSNCCNDCGCTGSDTCIANVCVAPTTTPTPTSTPTPIPTQTPTPVPGQPTSTPTPTSVPAAPTSAPASSDSSSSSTSSVAYYPSVALASFSPNPTNKTSLFFSGTASIQEGTISLVEYMLSDGKNWIPAQAADGNFNGKDERFNFTTSGLTEGKHTVKVRAKSAANVYTKSESYRSDTVTVVTTPPTVTLDKISSNPTKNQTPVIAGKASAKLIEITKIEITIDNGKSWQAAKRSKDTFSLTLNKLEDGNYPVRARAFDTAGNIGQSSTQTLIIDTIPPIIGGGMQSIGPQILIPDKNGNMSIVSGTNTTIAISMKGGVTRAEAISGLDSFKLSQKEGTNIWAGKIKFDSGGEKLLTISAIDGAGNNTERQFNTLIVENSGIVLDKKTNQPINNAKVSIYFFENISRQWILWEGTSYEQQNPQKTKQNGKYSFMAPKGKYYLEVRASGYNILQSEIIEVSQTSILNYKLAITPKPKIEFTLPIIGHVTFTVPSFSAPETFSVQKVSSQKKQDEENNIFQVGAPAPDFSLPNLENKEVNLADFKGKKLALSFISPWSALSLEQTPFLSQASASLKENQAILVISLQESPAATLAFMKKGDYKFPLVTDKDGKTAELYNITILPHHVFIDGSGRIQEIYSGVLSKEELVEKLTKLK